MATQWRETKLYLVRITCDISPAMTFYAGALINHFPGRKYLDALRFFEFSPKSPRPRGATLTRMRHAMPQDTRIALRAPRAALVSEQGPLRSSEHQAAELAWTLDAAERLGVSALVLPTPPNLMPGSRSRELLKRFSEQLPRAERRHYVWMPQGAWELEEAAELAHGLGLVCGFDPIQQERPAGEIVYARLTAMGAQTGFSEGALLDVFERIAAQPFREAYVSIDSVRSFQQAVRLQQEAGGGAPGA